MTTWPARRVGDRLLCGRPTPRGYCSGEVGSVTHSYFPDGTIMDTTTWPGFGFTEDPPGSHHWRMTERTARQRDARADARRGWRHSRSEGVVLRRAVGDSRGSQVRRMGAPLPWTRRCPICNVLVEVTTDTI